MWRSNVLFKPSFSLFSTVADDNDDDIDIAKLAAMIEDGDDDNDDLEFENGDDDNSKVDVRGSDDNEEALAAAILRE